MLTVVAIIGILAAILIPTVQIALRKARVASATSDVSNLSQAATAYNLDFGAFPPDSTAFWTVQGQQSDNPFPGAWSNPSTNPWIGPVAPFITPLNPNELLVWYLTTQYSTGQYNTVTNSYPAVGYPAGYPGTDASGDWTPSAASVVFSRVNSGPYFDMKAKQKTDVNQNGYYEFMDPWGRPYMYRAYPQSAQVASAGAPQENSSGSYTVTLTLDDLWAYSPAQGSYAYNPATYNGYNGYTYYNGYCYPQYGSPPPPNNTLSIFSTDMNLAGATPQGGAIQGSIQLSGFIPSGYNGTFPFVGGPNGTVNVTFPTNPGAVTSSYGGGSYCGLYTFPLHNPQSCDIYSLGPYGLTRGASTPNANGAPSAWKPTHGGTPPNGPPPTPPTPPPIPPWLDPTSLDAWTQVWGTPGDGNDINLSTGNILSDTKYQDNICNW
jgi:type II secretory pathway pseudopilin PulG